MRYPIYHLILPTQTSSQKHIYISSIVIQVKLFIDVYVLYCCDTWRDGEVVSLAHTELQVLHKKVAATARNNISLTSLTLPNWK